MLMKTKVLFLLAFVVFCCTSAMAQTLVKGTVVSANDSEPMIGVAILENGTTNGCITDMDGNYSISLQNSNRDPYRIFCRLQDTDNQCQWS